MSENTAVQLKKFFSTPEKPVSASEMSEFWKSLTDEEKAYYKASDLNA